MLRIQHLLVANVLHIIVRNKEYIIDVRNKKKERNLRTTLQYTHLWKTIY